MINRTEVFLAAHSLRYNEDGFQFHYSRNDPEDHSRNYVCSVRDDNGERKEVFLTYNALVNEIIDRDLI